MWAEDDLGPALPPCLGSCTQPEDNRVYTMYHGTSPLAAQQIMQCGFRQSKGGMFGPGVYVSRDLQKAGRYPLDLPEHQRVVLRLRVQVGRVKKIEYQGHPLQFTWHQQGYDTAWCPPGCGMVPSGLEEDCVWDPQRITVINVIRPKPSVSGYAGFYKNPDFSMWAEDDLGPALPPYLGSCTQPEDNRIYTMYHGTSPLAAQQIMQGGFRQSTKGMFGPGVYVSRDLQKASRYPLDLPEHQRVVLKLRVQVGRVKKIDHQGHPMQFTWHQQGYDTAWCPPGCGMVKSGLEEDCVWDPQRITVIALIRPKLGNASGFGGYGGYHK